MATTPESYKVTEHIINDDLLSKFQKLQDDHVGLQQILRNRVLPQQENADELISEAISKCRFVFSKKILEVRTEMNEMTRRIDDFADSVEKELNELETMVESLRAEQKRMKSSLPSEVLPSLLSLNRKSSTPKAVNSPKIIRKKENLPPSLESS
ncbi:hypothetical protein FO519_009207 [Halicephalobus sp. NKZ332]|nr:hypothetical protein FO519_009207 [Halicephalobus sp. NKZ332]